MRTEVARYAPLGAIIQAGGYAPCPSCKAPNDRAAALVGVADRQGLEVRYLRCSCCGQEWRQIEPFRR